MATTTSAASNVTPINDSAAGTKAQQYINRLYLELQTATSAYNTQNTLLKKYQTQQTDYNTKFNNAETLYTRLSANLKDAQNAKGDVDKITQFFSKQQSAVLEMVQNAHDMSTAAYESLSFLVYQGMGRVDAINTILTDDNKTFNEKKASDNPPPENVPVPWISAVTDAAGAAQASGTAAIVAGQDAVKAAFNAYIKNKTIYSRTTTYLNSFLSFDKDLQSLIDRLIKETSLAKHQSDQLKAQLALINERVTELSKADNKMKLEVDEARNKYKLLLPLAKQ